MEMDSPEHRRKRHAVIAVSVRSIMGVSRPNHTDGRVAEVYGRTNSSETTDNAKKDQYLIHSIYAYIIYPNADHSIDSSNALCRRFRGGRHHHPRKQTDHTEV